MKRFRLFLIPIVVVVAVAGGAIAGQDRILEHMVARELNRPDVAMLTDGRIHVVTVGTGTPRADASRVSACTAVIANGEFLMFDAGAGSIRQADLSDLPLTGLSTVFITHLHSDHMGGLGQTINHTWIWGRTEPLDVYGPAGIDQVVEGFRLAYERDAFLRNAHVGEEASPFAGSQAVSHPVALEGDAELLIFERSGVRVYAFAVDHGVVKPALGYRVEVGGRRIVISGDTKRDDRLIAHAANADILIHEAYRAEMVEQVAAVFKRMGEDARVTQVLSTRDYHTHPHDAADIAQRAGVKHLVFTHVIPPPLNPLVKYRILTGVGSRFSGPVTLADDGQRFVLEPVS